MTKLEIVQKIYGSRVLTEKELVNLFDVIKLAQEDEREECLRICNCVIVARQRSSMPFSAESAKSIESALRVRGQQ